MVSFFTCPCASLNQPDKDSLPNIDEPEVLPEGVAQSARLNMSKSDFNLELLKQYPYTTEERGVDENGKPQITYICKFDN